MKSFLGYLKEENMSLFTDFYELTMCASYFDNKNFEQATFDLFIQAAARKPLILPLRWIRRSPAILRKHQIHRGTTWLTLKNRGLTGIFLIILRSFKFTGEVWAVPEGTVAFPNEPLIRVTAPIIEAQLVETFLLNTVNLQTMIATKASRVVHAAKGKSVIEFGLRREHRH